MKISPERRAEMDDQFTEFDQDNPAVYKLFGRFTMQAINAGRERFGARMIWERIRWYVQVETTDTDFKLNDHYAPYYARKFMKRNQKYDGFFEIRGDS